MRFNKKKSKIIGADRKYKVRTEIEDLLQLPP